MAGPLCVAPCALRIAAGVVAAACLVVALPPAQANPEQKHGEQRDGQSRHEQGTLHRIPLRTVAGEVFLDRMIIIQARIVEVADASLGVEFESLDKVDVSGIPLIGGLFDRPLQAGDLTEANRVGTVYDAGDGALAAVIGEIADDDFTISVVNYKGRFNLLMQPHPVDAAVDLGPLGSLRSMQTMMAGTASQDTAVVLGGLTRTLVPHGNHKMPVLGDIPILQSLFRGTVHQRDRKELLVLIRPSVIVQEEE